MSWKFETDRPIYAQILEQMRYRIMAGEYQPGSKLPSVREMASEAGVNPNTMQRAMVELESSGYIITNRTTGRTVTEKVEVLEESKKNIAAGLTGDYVKKMKELGYDQNMIISAIKEEE